MWITEGKHTKHLDFSVHLRYHNAAAVNITNSAAEYPKIYEEMTLKQKSVHAKKSK